MKELFLSWVAFSLVMTGSELHFRITEPPPNPKVNQHLFKSHALRYRCKELQGGLLLASSRLKDKCTPGVKLD